MDKKRYIAEKYIEEAKQLHKENIVVDAHLDLAAEIFYRRLGGEKDIIQNRFLDNWKHAGLNLIVSSVFVESQLLPAMGLLNTMDQIAALYEELDSLDDELMIVKSKEDLRRLKTNHKIGILLYMEGLHRRSCFPIKSIVRNGRERCFSDMESSEHAGYRKRRFQRQRESPRRAHESRKSSNSIYGRPSYVRGCQPYQ